MSAEQDYKKAYERQKLARERAEDILEARSRELYEANQTLQEAYRSLDANKERLVQQEKLVSIGLLAGGIAHEINNPIAFIKSNLETLTEYILTLNKLFVPFKQVGELTDLSPDNVDYREQLLGLIKLARDNDLDYIIRDSMESINECVRGTQRVEDIILNLRDFTTGEQESRKLLDVNTLVRETVDLANAELKHSVNFHLELGEVPGIYGCKGQLKQVLINLITNASHAMDGEGDIYIKTCAEEEGAAIEVIDSGPGIEPEYINRLFDPFFTTRKVGTGTGLGLYICHGIVAKHDGEISVENTPTEGACFRIRLPASMRGSERD